MADQYQLQRTINEKATAHIPDHAWDSTVAIVIGQDDEVRQFGSAILFCVAEASFVVTAGHVVKEAHKNNWTLGISSANDFLVATSGQWLCSSEGQYGTAEDPLDVAVYKLPKNVVDRIGNKTFLRFDDVEFDSQSPTAVYTLFGFPGIWSKSSNSASENLQLKPFQFTTFAYDRDTPACGGYQDRFHLLLDGQIRGASNDDGSPAQFQNLDGKDAAFPRRLGGISGCSVWRIGDLNVPIDDWSQERSRVVAVQTAVYPEKQAIKATRWVAVSTLLHGAFPELRPAMSLWRPRYNAQHAG
jgi:hypothetical protein